MEKLFLNFNYILRSLGYVNCCITFGRFSSFLPSFPPSLCLPSLNHPNPGTGILPSIHFPHLEPFCAHFLLVFTPFKIHCTYCYNLLVLFSSFLIKSSLLFRFSFLFFFLTVYQFVGYFVPYSLRILLSLRCLLVTLLEPSWLILWNICLRVYNIFLF